MFGIGIRNGAENQQIELATGRDVARRTGNRYARKILECRPRTGRVSDGRRLTEWTDCPEIAGGPGLTSRGAAYVRRGMERTLCPHPFHLDVSKVHRIRLIGMFWIRFGSAKLSHWIVLRNGRHYEVVSRSNDSVYRNI
ncbi:hypothetical protein EVAR_23758_1 [Eumeta japonica]|uniref:Uncharacterized protein n=1 Tax=Eumeta variegata TaxID=151549 RepID=A0A4C1VGK6_EUMVA|nr:hypothetical protein EVAR_23758_1 [Eumeta japonica]